MTATQTFVYRSQYPCSAQELYDWHSREGALERLIPPFEKTSVLAREGGIAPGGRVALQLHAGPIPYRWEACHVKAIPGVMFRDIQHKGPFSLFSHSHHFSDTTNGSLLEDRIEYALPCHKYMPSGVIQHIDTALRRIFHHRQTVLRADLQLHQRCSTTPLRILISGASGVVGQTLVPLLTTGGHEVWTLVRRPPKPAKKEIFWDPQNSILDLTSLPQLDGVIHLAGEYIGLSRWSTEKKQRVMDSRSKGTRLLAATLAALPVPPKVFLSASAVGYYGDCHDQIPTEETEPGSDFISEVCRVWEEAAAPAGDAGIRTILMRLGVGLTLRGGALQRLMATAPLGFFRRFGVGDQYISWMSIDDMVSAMLHCLVSPELAGPLNIAAPQPVTNVELMQTLARVAARPLLVPVPAGVLKILYGQMAAELLLSSCQVSTAKLAASEFSFRHPSLQQALQYQLGKT